MSLSKLYSSTLSVSKPNAGMFSISFASGRFDTRRAGLLSSRFREGITGTVVGVNFGEVNSPTIWAVTVHRFGFE